MSASLDDLTKPLTRDEVKLTQYEALATVGVNTTNWFSGAVIRTMLAIVAIVVSALSNLTAAIARSGFLELSEGDWLTLVAKYCFGVDRILATFAVGEVTLTNSGGGLYVYDPDELIFVNPTTKKTFTNAQAVNLAALSAQTIALRALEEGAASTSAAGQISGLETPLLNVTVTNAAAVVGRDAETDPELRVRCMLKLGSLSPNGPADAYAFFARSAKLADGLTSAGITRVRVVKDGYGNVTTYCGTGTGGVTGTSSDISTPLGAAHDAIQRNATPLCVTETTQTGIPLLIPVTYSLVMYNNSGLTDAQIKAAITAKLVAFMSAQPLGGNEDPPSTGKVYQDMIRTTIGSTLPQIFTVTVTSPAADVDVDPFEIPTLGTVTATTVRQVATPTL